jgi:group I intron endonuclease
MEDHRPEPALRVGAVYLLRNLVNGKGYVGIALDENARWTSHIHDAYDKGSQYPIHRAIRKYGVQNFSAEVIYRCTEALLLIVERYFVRKLRTHVSQGGYNQTWGGDGVLGLKFTKESKRRLSESHLAYFKTHPEAGEAVRQAHLGKSLAAEHRAKISAKNTGRVVLASTCRKLSLAAKRRWKRPEYKAHQAAASDALWNGERGAAEREKRSRGARRRYQNPEERQRTAESIKRYWAKPGVKMLMHAAIIRGMKASGTYGLLPSKLTRKKLSLAQQRICADPAESARRSERNNRRYEDPAERRRTGRASKRAWARRKAAKELTQCLLKRS